MSDLATRKFRRLSAVELSREIDNPPREIAEAMIAGAVPLERPDPIRLALETMRGESYTDAEWSEASATLREFVVLQEKLAARAQHD